MEMLFIAFVVLIVFGGIPLLQSAANYLDSRSNGGAQ
ncbi:hypothetical protein LNAOJCKE_0386 [Methylorubrum aminovorans]|uniref:Uncharacterized protein n=1 Tax=Methylorubrum aminovorans TaxID=269069 RepID=A0ABQ4U8L0_9HYPH|nr:hypothetical protein LNAOJCKE_0386 [Methylorubrum aminovorans]